MKGLTDLLGDAEGVFDRQFADFAQTQPQRIALDERHGVVEDVPDLIRHEDGNDVGMRELRREFHLSEKPLSAHPVGELGIQHLDRHRSPRTMLLGEIHGGHASPPDLPLNRVPVSEGLLNFVDQRIT